MYRDEILAIGEAVREARADGIRSASDFYRGKLSGVCADATRAHGFVVDCAKLPAPPSSTAIEEWDSIDYCKTQAAILSEQLNTVRREAQRLNVGIRIPVFPDDVPF